MPDIKKVRGDLLAIKTYLNSQAIEAKDKIVREAFMESARNIDDAIALLKEQEAVEPIRDAICVRMFRCGACGAYVGFIDSDPGDTNEQDNYCRNCGKAVKWG